MNAARPKVLIILQAYLPGYKAGGPIRTIANLVDQLGGEFDFWITALDRDEGDLESYPDVETHGWVAVGGVPVFYRAPGRSGWRALWRALASQRFDLVYLNSFFSAASLVPLARRRLGRGPSAPILLAPRGEFSPGALALKPLKKRVFIALAKAVGLHRGVVYQASSDHEAADVRRVLGPVQVFVAGNPTGRSGGGEVALRRRAPADPLHVVFLSRISRKKNLAGALDILARVRRPVRFDVYGVMEDPDYWQECRARIEGLPPHVQASYRGPVRPEAVEGVLGEADLFLFPTQGENYGHVIREALSAGLPVLISDQTPWRGLADLNVGRDLPLDQPDAFARYIEEVADMDAESVAAMRRAARAHGDDPEAARRNLDANRAMLRAAAGLSPASAGGNPPRA